MLTLSWPYPPITYHSPCVAAHTFISLSMSNVLPSIVSGHLLFGFCVLTCDAATALIVRVLVLVAMVNTNTTAEASERERLSRGREEKQGKQHDCPRIPLQLPPCRKALGRDRPLQPRCTTVQSVYRGLRRTWPPPTLRAVGTGTWTKLSSNVSCCLPIGVGGFQRPTHADLWRHLAWFLLSRPYSYRKRLRITKGGFQVRRCLPSTLSC